MGLCADARRRAAPVGKYDPRGEGRRKPEKAISLAGAGYLWAITCVYMCGEPAWFVAEIAMMIMFILLLQALERREDAL